jgi:hypothetical protein
MPKKGRGFAGGRSIQTDLLEQRILDKLRAQVTELGTKRKAVLQKEMLRYLQFPPAFDVRTTEHHDGTPQVSINTAGAAKNSGFAFKSVRRFRLMLQETLRIGGGPRPFHIAHYTYAVFDAETDERVFRFEYHPHLEEGKDPYSLIHHFHVERFTRKLGDIHFPIWPFIHENDPHKVLQLVLEWCMEELRRIDA